MTLSAAYTPVRAECLIDHSAIRHNIATLRERTSSDLWIVVKADAYGHGVDGVVQTVVSEGVSRLCVATVSEAWHLRQQGVRVPILVMGPLGSAGIERALELGVEITVLSQEMIESLASVLQGRAARARRTGGRNNLGVHVKFDTGMGRWGLPPESLSDAFHRLADIDDVQILGIMTHFATSDDPDQTFMHQQTKKFGTLVDLARALRPSIIAHAANSGAILSSRETHFDAVRSGLATYGMSPMQDSPDEWGLKPVMSLRSVVADVKKIRAGESVGYCRTWMAQTDSIVAEVPIGYADGVMRSLSNKGQAIVNGSRYNMIGNVSMDHLALLIGADTGVDQNVAAGDVVTLIGSDQDAVITAEDHARWAGTINYEVTCGIATEPRLSRREVW